MAPTPSFRILLPLDPQDQMDLLELRGPSRRGILKVLPASGGDVIEECPLAGLGALHHLLLLVAQVPASPEVVQRRHTNTVRFDSRKHLVEIPWAHSEEHIPDQAFINRHTVQIVGFATEL
jgi:hypothetical protein